MTDAAGRLYLLHGMKRSGNHALVRWLRPQLGCAFSNNLVPLGPLLRGRPWPAPRPYRPWLAALEEQQGQPLPRMLASLEDHDLALQPFAEIDVAVVPLLVLRRADNLFASRLHKAFHVDMPAYPRGDGPVLRRAVALWKQHARAYLGLDSAAPSDRIAISYDHWCADAGYRAAISAALGVPFDDRGRDLVGGEGGGSSFDGTAFDGRAQAMRIDDRVSMLAAAARAVLDAVFADDSELRELHAAVLAADPHVQLRR